MRYNGFGEAYCHTVDEVSAYLDERSDGEVYVVNIHPPDGTARACAEVVNNDDGETVCYIEANTIADVRAIIDKAGIECEVL